MTRCYRDLDHFEMTRGDELAGFPLYGEHPDVPLKLPTVTARAVTASAPVPRDLPPTERGTGAGATNVSGPGDTSARAA